MKTLIYRNNTIVKNRSLHPAQKTINRYLFWLSFFMVFPGMLILGQNVSFLFFLLLLLTVTRFRFPITLNKGTQWWTFFFGVGAILSVSNIPEYYSDNAQSRSLNVVINYLYWVFLVIFLISNRKLINFQIIYKAIYWGVITTVIYYFFLRNILTIIPVFRGLTPNTYAFIMICFAPVATFYALNQKGKVFAVFFLLLLTLSLFYDGRRAGMVLVFLGSIAVIFSNELNFKKILAGIIITFLAWILINTPLVRNVVLKVNDRVYTLLYDLETLQKKDRSYLTRVAMVKKGMAIFELHPYTGIGLNNFSNYQAEISQDFEGSQYIIHKEHLNEFSAHNSYIMLLAEGGLFLLIPFLLLLAHNILYFVIRFPVIPDHHKPFLIALAAMAVHLYFIAAIVNVYAWFLIGLTSALVHLKQK